ncbi:hypothetical protein Tco_0169141 [Tanacetum coccineum]
MHPGKMHGQMRKKLRCVKVGFKYLKIADLVTRVRMLDFGLRLQESGSGDQDYYNRALLNYEAETGVPEGSGKRYKTYASSFNTESGEAGINLNVDVGDDTKDEVTNIQEKDEKRSQNDKTKHGNVKSVKSQSQSRSKSKSQQKSTPEKSKVKPEAKTEEILNGPPLPI